MSEEVKNDYAIFDASFLSHMTNDLVRNYNASEGEILNHLKELLQTARQLNPIVFYLSSKDVGNRLVIAGQSRGQSPPSDEQIAFWNERKQKDINVLSKLSVESHIKNISENNWDSVIDEIVVDIENKYSLHQEG